MVEFLKENINKTVKFEYKEEPKVVSIKSVNNTHLTGICNRDNIIKKYTLSKIDEHCKYKNKIRINIT